MEREIAGCGSTEPDFPRTDLSPRLGEKSSVDAVRGYTSLEFVMCRAETSFPVSAHITICDVRVLPATAVVRRPGRRYPHRCCKRPATASPSFRLPCGAGWAEHSGGRTARRCLPG